MKNDFRAPTGRHIQYMAALCLSLGAATAAQAETVYSNLYNAPQEYVGGFGHYDEIADDVFLGGTARIFESVSVAYTAWEVPAGSKLTLTIYDMTGPGNPDTGFFNTPGNILFQGQEEIVNSDQGTLLTFTDNSRSIILPDHVAVGLIFEGIGFDYNSGPDGGPFVINPPTVGGSYSDFFMRGYPNGGGDWALYTLQTLIGEELDANFALSITAVPDGGTWMNILGLPLLLGFHAASRRFLRR